MADYRELLKKRVGWPEPIPERQDWGIVPYIMDGDTRHAPDGNSVYDALQAIKVGSGGLRWGMQVTIKDATNLYVWGGHVDINGEIYNALSQITVDASGLVNATLYYLYVDAPGSGTTLVAGSFTLSTTGCTYDHAKGAYYKTGDGTKRWLANVKTAATGGYSWLVNGVEFTGTVVTVGPSGKDYTSIVTASNAVDGDAIIAVYPGTYNNNTGFETEHARYIKGIGDVATIYHYANSGTCYQFARGDMIIEGITMEGIVSVLGAKDLTGALTLSKVIMPDNYVDLNFLYDSTNAKTPDVTIRYCTTSGNTTHLIHGNTGWNINDTKITKSLIPNNLHTIGTTGSFPTPDHVTSPTNGYGAGYGTELIVAAANSAPLESVSQPIGSNSGIRLRTNFSNVPGE
jgi:hypothetical protein